MGDENKEKHDEESQPNYIGILSHQLKAPISSIQSLLNTVSEGFTGETNPKTLYFYRKTGAYKAYRYLMKRGYTNLRVLEGGYIYWER